MTIYCFSTDEERFTDSCEAESYEAAAEIAREELCLEDGQSFYVGIREEVHPERHLRATRILEDICDNLYDEVGEWCEGWPDATMEQVADLDKRLTAVFVEWMKDAKCVPTFYKVGDMRRFLSESPLDESDE